ncbi:MAG: DEAD/DEAH box helicase, partial [Vitreimonas sp.]
PYAGVRSSKRDSTRLSTIGEFFVNMEIAAARYAVDQSTNIEEDRRAAELLQRLRVRGKWPSKQSMADWFGKPGTKWQNKKGEFVRAVMGPHDAELLTRHEVHDAPPDLLITNYSMLEYMMLRPIERDIFTSTRAWLEARPDEKILVVLNEAHLYRGAQGAEVGLLLRRLRERLNIGPDRFQVICATASFSEDGKKVAEKFGAQLTGAPEASFYKVEGTLKLREPATPGTAADAKALAGVALADFYDEDPALQAKAIAPLLAYRGVTPSGDVGADLVAALGAFPPFNTLVNETMRRALPLAGLGAIVFPGVADSERAIDALLALGSRARKAAGDPSLIPCRIHSFFRGLPGLWACMDPQCSALPAPERGAPVGKLYAQPVERCSCNAPVLEYFTCRYCGSSYARAYTNSLAAPHDLWAEPGQRLMTEAGFDEAYSALDLLLQEPIAPDKGEAAYYDLTTGQLNPKSKTALKRVVYLRPKADGIRQGGEFTPCGCCERIFSFGASSVQDHQTKGDQPFQALLTTQVQVQPPGPMPASQFAPLRGRKVLIFSDSRQMAARLVQLLQGFSLRDTVRALLPLGFKLLAQDATLGPKLSLNYAYIAVLVAA